MSIRALIYFFLVSLFLFSCQNKIPLTSWEGQAMGSSYHISIAENLSDAELKRLKLGVDEIFKNFNKALSTYQNDSEISKFNQAQAGEWMAFSPMAYELLSKAWYWSKESDGAFDITVGPLVRLWGFENEKRRTVPPLDSEIAKTKKDVGYQYLKFDETQRKISKAVSSLRLDVGAIAPGYASDLISKFFKAMGYSHHMIEVGGEIKVSGFKEPSQNKAWRIGVESSSASGEKIQRVLELHNESVSTSGDYRDFFIYKGKRYSHTLNSQTGKPIDHDLSSVTVIYKDCADADALATVLMVLGPEKGFEFAQKRALKAIFYIRKGKEMVERLTDEMKKVVGNV